jgi:ornithine decarboxylase
MALGLEDDFLLHQRVETPFLVIDINIVTEKYQVLQDLLPEAQIYYAVKANPEPEVLGRLVELGASFDAASIFEIQQCLSAGANPAQISYGNTIKKARDIQLAYQLGVRLFSFDSWNELEKLAINAPGSRVCCRLLIETEGAEWNLGRKFGCEPEMAYDLLLASPELGLVPFGLAFHVGSQQTDPLQWDAPIQLAAGLFDRLSQAGVQLELLNLGGGFPAHYQSSIPAESIYTDNIRESIERHFGATPPSIMLEPGRSLVADAGVLHTEVVLISQKSYTEDLRWVFLDAGKFNGLIETMDECIKYRITSTHDGTATGPVVLAGPTCDSADILYEKIHYELPLNLRIGDRLQILSTGAYTHTYASVGFNGFRPLKVYCIDSKNSGNTMKLPFANLYSVGGVSPAENLPDHRKELTADLL